MHGQGLVIGPMLLLAGAWMVVDPGGLTRLSKDFETGIRNFESYLLGTPMRRNYWRLHNAGHKKASGVRIAGLVVIAVGLTAIATA